MPLRCLPCVAVAVCAAMCGPVAGSPRDELLRLVPPDVGFCLVIEDLRGHGTALLDSPFFKQFRVSATATKLIESPETKKLSRIDEFLKEKLNLTSTELRDEIIGDALVIAYRPGPPAKPEQEDGLLMLHARNPKLLADLIDRVNVLQKAPGGDLERLDKRSHANRAYFCRVESKSENFYYVRGSLLVFSTREGILKQVIDADSQSAKEQSLSLTQQLNSLDVGKPLAALWVNPRSFEPALEHRLGESMGAQAVALKQLLTYWKAIEGIAITLNLEKDLELAVSVRARSKQFPPATRRFLQTAAQRSDLWSSFPDHAMFAVAARVDVDAIVDAFSEFLADDAKVTVRMALEQTVGAIVGTDVVHSLVKHLGPDFGFCATAPPDTDKSFTPRMIAAVRLQSTADTPSAELSLANAVNSLATLLVFSQNGGRPGSLKLQATVQDGVEVKYLMDDDRFPPGFRPSFALKSGYALFGSSPDAIGEFRPRLPLPPNPTSEVPLLRVSLQAIVKYLGQRRSQLIEYNASQKQVSKEAAAQGLDNLVSILKFFDRVEVVARPGSDRATIALRIRMSQPLK